MACIYQLLKVYIFCKIPNLSKCNIAFLKHCQGDNLVGGKKDDLLKSGHGAI